MRTTDWFTPAVDRQLCLQITVIVKRGLVLIRPILALDDCVTLGLVDEITQLMLGLLGRGLRAADRNRAT